MVEAEEDPARRAGHAPPQRRPQQQQHHHHHHHHHRHHQQGRTSSSGWVASHSRLHNFSFPSVSWGNQRLLRCAKVESCGEVPADPRGVSPSPLPDRGSAGNERGRLRRERDRKAAEGGRDGEEEEEDERLDKFRDAMMAEFRKAFDRIPLPPPPCSAGLPPGEQKEEREKFPAAAAGASAAEAARPWNLRLRRAACNAPAAAATENVRARSSPSAPEKNSVVPAKYSLRSDAGSPKEERRKFSPVLSKEEIEEDFFVMTGSKPPRRPKKRARNVQKQLESVYPGLYLTEVTPDLYKITEDK